MASINCRWMKTIFRTFALFVLCSISFLPKGTALGVDSYVVPAISPIKRLPESVPTDGKLDKNIIVFCAKGEVESASFMLFAKQDLPKVELKVSDLKSKDHEIPASFIDLKVVKCWYQGGTSWTSYFPDPSRRELTPELLLHDENLVKVDSLIQENYLRADAPAGSKYAWVSYPMGVNPGKFNVDLEPIGDTPTIQPIALEEGKGKQLWVTIKVPEDAQAGIYHGKINMVADGKDVCEMGLSVRVLPFSLPLPKTYYDMTRDFYASMQSHTDLLNHFLGNGMDLNLAEKKLLEEFKNMRDHNLLYPHLESHDLNKQFDDKAREVFVKTLELMKESGVQTKPVFGAVSSLSDSKVIDAKVELVKKVFGHHEIYTSFLDKPSRANLVSKRENWEHVHTLLLHTGGTGKDAHLYAAGYNQDMCIYAGSLSPESARKWHAIGGRIFSYANPQVGPENPDFSRRVHGMSLYKADYDGTSNYCYYIGYGSNIWNDFDAFGYGRTMGMVYPTRDGVIDTLQWEGYREAIDDIRYATKLKEVAAEACSSQNVDVQYAGKRALQWLALLDEKKADLNAMRLEMIQYILQILSALNEKV